MNNDEKKEQLHFLQKFFAANFWISFVLLFVASAACVFMHDMQLAIVQKYFPMSLEQFNYLIILSFGIWKILIIQFTLIPALAIWGIRKCCDCKCHK